MDTKEQIKKEIASLYEEGAKLAQALQANDKTINFAYEYQAWYTRALRVVEVLAADRYGEFRSYYEPDPKRKQLGYGTYVIQDHLKGVAPSRLHYSDFDTAKQALIGFFNQLTILHSLTHRIDAAIGNIEGGLYSELQDAELATARELLKVNLRAAGVLAGVIVETYLQKLAKSHGVSIRKKNPTIGDLNDPLKEAEVFDTPTWRKVAYLADIRNLCSHKKDVDPTRDQVVELIEGANWLIKNTF